MKNNQLMNKLAALKRDGPFNQHFLPIASQLREVFLAHLVETISMEETTEGPISGRLILAQLIQFCDTMSTPEAELRTVPKAPPLNRPAGAPIGNENED